MEKKKDVRNVLMVALVFAIMVMAVGYAALAQRLTVNGKATIGDAKWKVRITDISFDETASNISTSASTQSLDPAEAAVGEGSTGAKFDVTLGAPGDKAVYNITVTNLGTIEAELKEITDLATVNAADPADIKFTVKAATDNAATLVADATHKYTVTVEWLSTAEEVPTVTEKTATINFDYEQA